MRNNNEKSQWKLCTILGTEVKRQNSRENTEGKYTPLDGKS